jgi:hypothetical protein
MSNFTVASRTFKPTAPALPTSLLREIFEATPLAIFAKAWNAPVRQALPH